ncbi:MAG: acyltransferase [Cyanobacteria bacterium P01_G01_bin.54]
MFTSTRALKKRLLASIAPLPDQHQGKYFFWVDYAKGIGITFMVLGHVIRGLSRSNLLTEHHWLLGLDQWIYAFHMSLFFFLSGLFVQSSLRKSTRSLMVQRLKRMVYPYFLWSLMQGTLKIILPQQSNDSVTISNLLDIFHTPLDQFWFLYVLFLLLAIHTVCNKFIIPNTLFLGITALLTVIYVNQLPFGDWGVFYILARYILSFAAGVYLGVQKMSHLQSLKSPLLLAIALLTGAILTIGVGFGFSENQLMSYPLAACGVLMAISIAMMLVRLDRLGRLVIFGKYSLQIYLAHVLIIAAGRILVLKLFGYTDVYVHTILGLLIGIYVPLWLQEICQKYKFNYLFAWGR